MECLENVIKLSQTTCECFEDVPPDYNEGKADIYLDELEGLSLDLANGSENCEQGNIWDMMAKARTNATKEFKKDLLDCVNSNYMPKRNGYKGLVGNVSFNQTLNYTENMSGLAGKFSNIVGGKMIINRIGLLFSTTSTFNVSIYSSDDLTTPIATYPVTSAANSLQYVTLSTPLELPLWSNQTSIITYFVAYDLIGTYKPKNNKADCGCTNKQAVAYKHWGNFYGIKGNSPSSLDSFNTTTEFNGLVLDVEFQCDTKRIICSDDMPLDFENDSRAMNIAYCIRYQAGYLLAQLILDTQNINRYTMLDREALYGKRNYYKKSYFDLIGRLCETTQITNTDCLKCRPNNNFSKGAIFS